jgi:hypothetical protein
LIASISNSSSDTCRGGSHWRSWPLDMPQPRGEYSTT